MYRIIEQFAPKVVGTIPADFVTEYEWLLRNLALVKSPEYQKKYRKYWAMNVAQLGADFYTVYFGNLELATRQLPIIVDLVQTLYNSYKRRDGRQTIQFSFATKLLHMASPQLPIYDSRVAAFYFFQEPSLNLGAQQRIDCFIAFYDFLSREYARVLQEGLLAGAIQAFRDRFNSQHFTDEKIIDLLIWAFVTLLNKGGLPSRQIVYS